MERQNQSCHLPTQIWHRGYNLFALRMTNLIRHQKTVAQSVKKTKLTKGYDLINELDSDIDKYIRL